MKDKEARRVSIINVAEKAGVGVGTVSRVLNNKTGVSPTANQAVRRAMALLGYRPPPKGSRRGPRPTAKKTSLRNTDLTLIILAQHGMHWILQQAPVLASVLHGIQSATSESGSNLLISQATDWNQLLLCLQQSKGKGCLIMGEEPPGEPPAEIRHGTAVWVTGSIRRFEGDHVQPDHFGLGQMAAHYLLAKGHRHCAYIGAPISPSYHVSLRGAAFQWWIEHEGGTVAMLVSPDIIVSDVNEHHGNKEVLEELIDQLIAASPRPTGLMVQADILAPPVYELLRNRGVEPQKDIQIITCNNENAYLSYLNPKPVVLNLQAETIGRRAVDQLHWRMNHPGEPAMRVMIQPLLIDPAGSPKDA